MNDPTIALLRELVAIDSVNPSLVPGGAGERQIAAFVADELKKMKLDVEIQEVESGRPNVIGVLEGKQKGRSLILCGHLDTVGVIGMREPFRPEEKDGRLYGRGAQDMKGGLASMISAAGNLAANWRSGRLMIAAVIDEEYASIGAQHFIKEWKADAAIVTEPSDLFLGIAHKGFSWCEVITRGRAAHGSRPLEGRDAILYMGRILTKLENLGKSFAARKPHPYLGSASLHASLIEGGRELSTYPDSCTLRMERRLIHDEELHQPVGELREIIAQLKKEDAEFSADVKFLFGQPPYEFPRESSDLLDHLKQAVAQSGRSAEEKGMTFWTDAAILGNAGIPSIVFGPGGAGLHGVEEYVLIQDVLDCRDALAETARSFCLTS